MDTTIPSLLALPTQKHARTSDLPLLGFVVWWSLSGLRVPHPQLVSAMRSAGFGAYVPHAPSYPKALRRALQAWVSYQAEPLDPWEDEEALTRTSTLIRTVYKRGSRHVLFALVAESQRIAALGLSYATALRILLDKKEGGMVVTTERSGAFDIRADEKLETIVAAEDEARHLAMQLDPLWDTYRDLHLGSDLTGVVRRILCGETVHRYRRHGRANGIIREGLEGVPVRRGGGLYFVPATYQEALERLHDLILALPTSGTAEPYFMMVPVLDDAAARQQLARATHEGFLDEIATLQRDLESLKARDHHHPSTLTARLSSYKRTLQRLDTYADLLGLRRERISQQVQAMRQEILDLLTDETLPAD